MYIYSHMVRTSLNEVTRYNMKRRGTTATNGDHEGVEETRCHILNGLEGVGHKHNVTNRVHQQLWLAKISSDREIFTEVSLNLFCIAANEREDMKKTVT